MNELKLEIVLGLNKPSVQSVKSALAELQSQGAETTAQATGTTEGNTNATKKNTDAKKQQIAEARRAINVAEADFRLGKLKQAQLIDITQETFQNANAQGILNAEIDKNGSLYKSLSQSQLRAQQGFKGVGDESRRANFALINLGRIIQDLPFGFLGISNNISPALESIQALNVETGGFIGTSKALLKSLGGVGGVIFALGSVLPSAVLIATHGFNMYRKRTKDATESTDEFISALTRLRETSTFSFLGKSGIEAEIRSLEEIKLITEEIVRLSESAGNKGRLTGDPEVAKRAQVELNRLIDIFGISTEDAQKYIDRLDILNKHLLELDGKRATSELGMFREETEKATKAALDLVETTGKNQNAVRDLAEAYFESAQELKELIKTSSELEKLKKEHKKLTKVAKELEKTNKDLTGATQKQADALGQSISASEDARVKYDLLVETGRDLMSTYNGYADAVDGGSLATAILNLQTDKQSNAQEEATRQTRIAEQALKDLFKLAENPPEIEPPSVTEERGLQQALALQALKTENEIASAQGLTQELLKIEANFNQRKFDLGMQGLLNEDILRELEIEKERKKNKAIVDDTEATENKKKAIRQQFVNASFQMASGLLSSLQQLNQSQTDQSEAQAKKRFEMEKKLSIAQALVNGAAAIVKTYQTFGFPTGIPFAIAQAAATALQIKAIKDTQFNSGGSSRGGNASASASDKQGFFTTTEPKRPRTEAPIVINMSGDLDPEFLSVKVEKGNKARKRGTIFVASNQ